MNASSDESTNSRTLYVGNLDPTVTEELLMILFSQIGSCISCKIIYDPNSDPYAFVEFAEHQAAAHALLAMNKRLVMGREIRVNWATTSASSTSKIDTSKHYHIFVGDLAPELDQTALHEAFSPFGEISEVKIAKFPDTQKSRGYAFIAFTNQNDAETAIASMNGQWLGTRKIRTNWATRKVPTNETTTTTRNRDSTNAQYAPESSSMRLDYNEVWNRTSETNSTVYFGGCSNINEDLIRSVFRSYGPIQEIRVFKEKGYAFVRFNSKENACQAICHLHGSDDYGFTVKCGWGRDESINDRNTASSSSSSSYGNDHTFNQNYQNTQHDSYSQNSYGLPMNNMNFRGDHRGGFNNPDNSYQQQNYNSQQWNNGNNFQMNSMRDPYFQPSSGRNWNNSNSYNPGPNFNQPQSHMYSHNPGSQQFRR